MCEDEKRRLLGDALIEFEESRRELALLRTKADSWLRLQTKIIRFLEMMRRARPEDHFEAAELRIDILRNRASMESVATIDATLALDKDIEAALARFERAEKARKDLGFE